MVDSVWATPGGVRRHIVGMPSNDLPADAVPKADHTVDARGVGALTRRPKVTPLLAEGPDLKG
jgi:hypothetical protein